MIKTFPVNSAATGNGVEADFDHLVDPVLEEEFKEMATAATSTATLELAEDNLTGLLECFLCLNPSPSDEQVHALSKALGLSKEAVEQVIYTMLSQRLAEGEDDGSFTDEFDDDLSLSELALIDNRDPAYGSLYPPFDENDDHPDQPSGYAPSIIVDPIDTDERLANDGMPDEHIMRIRRAEIGREPERRAVQL